MRGVPPAWKDKDGGRESCTIYRYRKIYRGIVSRGFTQESQIKMILEKSSRANAKRKYKVYECP